MKRTVDIVLAGLLLIIFVPMMALIAAAILFDLGQPIIFRQLRPGLRGKPFTLLKFRTMRLSRVPEPSSHDDSERLTRFGMWLRRTSLDELPELWNILRGDMSFVGPRPLLMRYLDLYTPEEMRRHDVRPGLTGWAQVNGRNALTWEQKFSLDVWYVQHRGMLLDAKILLLTVRTVFAREGISAKDSTTMPEFTRSKQGYD